MCPQDANVAESALNRNVYKIYDGAKISRVEAWQTEKSEVKDNPIIKDMFT